MPVYALFIESLLTGRIMVLTFPTADVRAYEVIARSAQPVRMRLVDYAHDGLTAEQREAVA